jgi:hypothetical protein
MTSTPRPATRRKYDAALELAVRDLRNANELVASFARIYDAAGVIPDPIAALWNAAHDAVGELEANVREIERAGYGRPVVETELSKLVAANID